MYVYSSVKDAKAVHRLERLNDLQTSRVISSELVRDGDKVLAFY